MIALVLTNEEEVVFSASSATEGGHTALRHIPGAAFWGAIAAKLYGVRAHDTFRLLHSGKVRVSPGFPLTRTGAPAFPIPQTFQGPKHDGKGLQRDKGSGEHYATITPMMRNGLFRDTKETVALDGPREWYVAADGSMIQPLVRERGKAATEPGSRRVASGQFFQYVRLQPYQDWLMWIDADDSSAEAEFADFLTRQPLVLGRSKRREFGGTFRVNLARGWTDPRSVQFAGEAKDELVLWCLSDLALVDEWGKPNLAPELEEFGIGGIAGKLDNSRSAINVHRYAPFNTFLGGCDREHAVISAGSVLAYKLRAPVSRAVFRNGIGLWRERGLGLLWPDAPMLLTDRPHNAIADSPVGGTDAISATRSESGPLAALSETHRRALDSLRAYAEGRRDGRLIADATRHIKESLTRQLLAISRRGAQTPSATQWSLIADKTKASLTIEQLRAALLRDDGSSDRGVCVGPSNREWEEVRSSLEKIINTQHGVNEKLAAARREHVFLRAFSQAARGIARERQSRRALP